MLEFDRILLRAILVSDTTVAKTNPILTAAKKLSGEYIPSAIAIEVSNLTSPIPIKFKYDSSQPVRKTKEASPKAMVALALGKESKETAAASSISGKVIRLGNRCSLRSQYASRGLTNRIAKTGTKSTTQAT
ncbi:MAG: hypothetical protein RLZZ579_1003 [Actinomycetota bacterium]|jgi:hypothetical protein